MAEAHPRWAVLAGACTLALLAHACNAIWGLDDLDYGAAGTPSGGTPGGLPTTSSSSTATTGGTSGNTTTSGSGAYGGTTSSSSSAGGAGAAAGQGGVAGAEPLPVCGNGTAEGTEQCDDGDTLSGDGCSSTCQMECAEGAFMRPTTFHCYWPSVGQDDWDAAVADCLARGQHLVTYSNASEYLFVQDQLPAWNPEFYWIGARDAGSGYEWDNGEPFVYEAWHPAEPDPGMCAFSGLATNQWFTAGCVSNEMFWVCEQEPAGW